MRWQGLTMKAISEGMSLMNKFLPSRNGLRIIMYHSVGTSILVDPQGLNNIEIDLFLKHADILADGLTSSLLPLAIPGNELRTVITFDDGYADNLYIAAPILVERNIPFTVFITTDFIRNRRKGFLSPDEVKQLSLVPGVTMGTHSKTHPHLTQCDDTQLKIELEDSKHYLEDLIGKEVTTMSYPHGHADLRVRDAVQQAGYEIAVCSNFDINQQDRDKLLLNRCFILCDDTTHVLKQKLRGDWDWLKHRYPDPINIK